MPTRRLGCGRPLILHLNFPEGMHLNVIVVIFTYDVTTDSNKKLVILSVQQPLDNEYIV